MIGLSDITLPLLVIGLVRGVCGLEIGSECSAVSGRENYFFSAVNLFAKGAVIIFSNPAAVSSDGLCRTWLIL
ncbi:hypothetical protein S7S_05960 [Isoalcanivorax pacificus W11-5]|uniref:Uncharacterized protein n=1 Tax=Isoalcanivorax pacificus W11-5 TaxID=391936 RepID=A0A0B4XLN9_9GAMM|nr:hypothetical protein S7S_05960 [Isoalcanivorax pacificus W11-5]